MGAKRRKKEKGKKRGRKHKVSEREFFRGKGEQKKNVEVGSQQKRGEKRKEKREGRREGRRSGDLRNLMSIRPSNLSRSFSNFDITLYSTPKTTEWSSIEISMVGFL